MAWLLAGLTVACGACGEAAPERPGSPGEDTPAALFAAGNFAEAYDAYRRRLLSGGAEGDRAATALRRGVECLSRLGRLEEFDPFVEAAVAQNPEDWRVLIAAAAAYQKTDHTGRMIDGKFRRSRGRGRAEFASVFERDRVRALQLSVRAIRASRDLSQLDHAAHVPAEAARMLMQGRNGGTAWRLQLLTDLSELPPPEPGWGARGDAGDAPVGPDGDPVLYRAPESWDAAANDGERWRWLLAEATRRNPDQRRRELEARADFAASQFGVQTLGSDVVARLAAEDAGDAGGGLFALSTLDDDECLARLANGVRRFRLAGEFHPLGLRRQLLAAAQDAGDDEQAYRAAGVLAHTMLDRRQRPRAVGYFREQVKASPGPGRGARRRRDAAQRQIEQLLLAWGEFQSTRTEPAGVGAPLVLRHRNAAAVKLTARPIDVPRLLSDAKRLLKSKPTPARLQQATGTLLGTIQLEELDAKYLGPPTAQWRRPLDSPADHADAMTTISSPLSSPGAYLVTATVERSDGKPGAPVQTIQWVADTVLLAKPMADGTLMYVADAATGAPIAGANIELLGVKQTRREGNPRRYDVSVRNEAIKTGDGGLAVAPFPGDPDPFAWRLMAIARAPRPGGGQRMAFLGFDGLSTPRIGDARPREASAYVITDRPLYRPGQTVRFMAWVARSDYAAASDAASEFAHKQMQVELFDARGDRVLAEKLTAGATGGVAGEYTLPAGAPLGVYRLQVNRYGSGSFRVEEYKKPEFEVAIDAPQEAVRLGEAFTARVRAEYYFGSPVSGGKVRYKVTRTKQAIGWFPPRPWDWLYGEGYGWLSVARGWYPGYDRWGCPPPPPWWWRGPVGPPEVVARGEAPLAEDGTYGVRIDTQLAKALHGDSDHLYRIEAEVTDASRRVVSGVGAVTVARKPFAIFVWLGRGFYRTGDVVRVQVAARKPDGEPLASGRAARLGKLRLLKISYPDDAAGPPTETEVRQWELALDGSGRAELQIKASEAGQYRVAFELPTAAGSTVEGATLLAITGPDGQTDGAGFRFGDLELTPDRPEYAPGETARLLVGTVQTGGTVLLFQRPVGGVYTRPKVLRLAGTATTSDLPLTRGDQPNVFVEAVTIAGGRLHTVARRIAVPPAERVLQVEVLPGADAYQPGAEATVEVRVTDRAGEPYAGELVVTAYDRSLEAIAGGPNVPGIREHFWNWTRSHHPRDRASLSRSGWNFVPSGERRMARLGRFDGWGRGFLGLRLGTRIGRQLATLPVMEGRAGEAADSDSMLGSLPSTAESQASQLVTPTVRSEFADTAFWTARLQTDTSGLAEVRFELPENLTAWKLRVWGMGAGTRVGEGESQIVTRKDLLVRLQAPRFLVDRDQVVLSANVHNYLQAEKKVHVRLQADGDLLQPPDRPATTVTIPPGEDRRVDWRLSAINPGEATVRVFAETDEESDAAQLSLPVVVRGAPTQETYSGMIAAGSPSASFEFTIPAARRVDGTRLDVRFSPSLAGAMLDALPYLIEYPHGCTEQTLNRFLPAVLVRRTLERMDIDLDSLADAAARLDATRAGRGEPAGGAALDAWRRDAATGEARLAVLDRAKLDEAVREGVRRLTQMQLDDGGWGWFSGRGERSGAHTTAVVVRGLLRAQEDGAAVVPDVLQRGVAWLERYRKGEIARLQNSAPGGEPIDQRRPFKPHADNLDALVHLVLVRAGRPSDVMRPLLLRDKRSLSPYGLALLGLALEAEGGRESELAAVIRNLRQFEKTDPENQTTYLDLPNRGWWYWHGHETETQAAYLKLLAATAPRGEAAAGLVKYLLARRRHGAYWDSTRDTALVIEAMADFLQATGEGQTEQTVQVWLDGQRRKQAVISPRNSLVGDYRFSLDGAELAPGRHTLELRTTGGARLYWAAAVSNFSLAGELPASGRDLRVRRRVYKITPEQTENFTAAASGQPVRQRGERARRTEVTNLASVAPGDLIEVELTLSSKNDYEYLVLTDHKAAGFEPVDSRSGYTGNALGAYVEYRDRVVHLFLRSLARGERSVCYRLRAVTPGRFCKLPAEASAMYAPELRGNSRGLVVGVVEVPPPGDTPR